jgi:hypothetical protein
VKEIGMHYDQRTDTVAIYKSVPGEKAPNLVPVEEYSNCRLLTEFSAHADRKYLIWVRLMKGLSEDRFEMSQTVKVGYQSTQTIAPNQHFCTLPRYLTVAKLLEYLSAKNVIPGSDLVVYKVVNHTIADRFDIDSLIYKGDDTFFVAKRSVVEPNDGQKVLCAVHAVAKGTKLKPCLDPFFVTVVLTEKVSEFLDRVRHTLGIADNSIAKIILGNSDLDYDPQTVLRGDDVMANVLAAHSGMNEPLIFIVHPPNAKQLNQTKLPLRYRSCHRLNP